MAIERLSIVPDAFSAASVRSSDADVNSTTLSLTPPTIARICTMNLFMLSARTSNSSPERISSFLVRSPDPSARLTSILFNILKRFLMLIETKRTIATPKTSMQSETRTTILVCDEIFSSYHVASKSTPMIPATLPAELNTGLYAL